MYVSKIGTGIEKLVEVYKDLSLVTRPSGIVFYSNDELSHVLSSNLLCVKVS
jgi:hypothetical protein